MFVRLQPLIRWPGREELLKTMPLSFKANFKQCVVVMDCFEVFCERPKALKARAQTWSHYKHHNTVKFLKHPKEQFRSYLKDGEAESQIS